MKLPVSQTEGHEGKSLEFDLDNERLILFDEEGQPVRSVDWAAVCGFVRASGYAPPRTYTRADPRVTLAVKVRYNTSEGRQIEGITSGLSAGGLFIEASEPLPRGSELKMRFTLPDHPWEPIATEGKVAWIRTRTERIVLLPGMGLMFTDISPEDRKRVEELIAALNRATAR